MLQQTFEELLTRHSSDPKMPPAIWEEVVKQYTSSKRHYHNLTHLENMLEQLTECKSHIEDWDTILFALIYHDIIYEVTKKDNEEKSASLAVKRLAAIHYPANKCALCRQHILATKSHGANKNTDTNFFTDADLSILGAPVEIYFIYVQQIRMEYAIYPDLMYRPGRKKVLKHFLQMERIYKTAYFFEKYEQAANENMLAELQSL